MNREQFDIIYNLHKNQPWIANEPLGFEELLWKDCRSSEERELILRLLNRFTYVSQDQYRNAIDWIADRIIKSGRFIESETQVIAMSADSSPDSAQYLIYDLKNQLQKKSWNCHQMANRFGDSFKNYKKNTSIKDIILIDEFIGSGQSAQGRISTLKRTYENADVKGMRFHVLVIAAMKEALDMVKKAADSAQCMLELKKGITDFENINSLDLHKKTMSNLEDDLLQTLNNKTLPRFGYSESEALYTREHGNTPNNVFPIFWWPFRANKTKRNTILTRAEDSQWES